MICPRCGSEMELDSHRKIPLYMCYNCGYIEGRSTEGGVLHGTNYNHLMGLNINETAAFLSKGLGLPEDKISAWLADPMN
jgi:hypothetical protein